MKSVRSNSRGGLAVALEVVRFGHAEEFGHQVWKLPLYKKREEVVAMNAPLPALATGVYQEQKSGGYKLFVEPIGSTTAE